MSEQEVPRPVQLYRHFNDADELLYVGISLSAVARLGQHVAASPWVESIAKVTIQTLPNRRDALVAEREAIKAERPKHNTQHTRPDKPERVPKQAEVFVSTYKEAMTYKVATLKPVYDLPEVGDVLGMGTASVKRLISSGELGYIETPKQNLVGGVNTRVTGWQILEYLEYLMKKN